MISEISERACQESGEEEAVHVQKNEQDRHDLQRVGINDQITSIWNRGSLVVRLYDYIGYTGCYVLLWQSNPGNWGNLPPQTNDRTDLVRVGGFEPTC